MLQFGFWIALFGLISCAHVPTQFPVSKESVNAGTSVKAGGKDVKLRGKGSNLRVGKSINPILKTVSADKNLIENRVAVISIVPSVDTAVCESQTHVLGETKKLHPSVARVTVSRDLPMAQQRFAREGKLESVLYLSDYKNADFGRNSGLLLEDSQLLARAVVVVDSKGIIKYIQVVPDVATLPDMDKAFEVANALVAAEKKP